MKTILSQNNPYDQDQLNWAYGWEFIKENDVVLDYGCFDARFLKVLSGSKKVQVFGADKNQDIVNSVKQNGGVTIVHIEDRLPFDDEMFDVVTMFEVLEHVHNQKYLLSEINRVLKVGGLFVISVPQKHVFSFLDWGNWKYVFPKFHRYWYTRKYSAEEYHYRYVDNPSGLIGDVDKEKAWHQHFKVGELTDLLQICGFSIHDLDGFGGFGIPLIIMKAFLKIPIPSRLMHWQNIKFSSEKLLCVSKKSSSFRSELK